MITSSQVWSILKRHANDDIEPLRLHELCRDNDRVSSLVSVYNTTFVPSRNSLTLSHSSSVQSSQQKDNNEQEGGGENRILIVDLSRQRMTIETLNHLLKLATSRNLRAFTQQLAWGQNDPHHPILPARMHDSKAAAAEREYRNRKEHQKKKKKSTRFLEMEPPSSPTSNSNANSYHHQPQQSYYPNQQHHHHHHHQTGSNSNSTTTSSSKRSMPPSPSMHMALRVPANKGYEMLSSKDGVNVLTEIHREWIRLERLSDAIRRGTLRGVTGNMIRDVVVVGQGVPVSALKFVYAALIRDERAVLASRFGLVVSASGTGGATSDGSAYNTTSNRLRRNLAGGGLIGVGGGTSSSSSSANNSSGGGARRLKFVTSVDPIAAADIVSDLDAASTVVISIALNGNEETGLATKTLKTWLLQTLGSGTNRRADHILAKHMMLVTGNDRIVSAINKPESVHIIPEHSRCEAFCTFSPATLLPLSIVFGWGIVQEFLNGAHDMDNHFVETNPRHCLPVLLALADIWNDSFLDASARIITPFSDSFSGYASFVGTLEAQTCSRKSTIGGPLASGVGGAGKRSCSATVINAGLDGSFDRAFYQSSKVMNTELIMTMDNQIEFNTSRRTGSSSSSNNNGKMLDEVYSTQDAVMCSLFAHADELAFGYKQTGSTGDNPLLASPIASATNAFSPESDFSDGNRPSLLLMSGKMDAFACGQLAALAEHRAVTKAHIWGLDPFVREIGSSLRMYRTDQLKEDLHDLFTHPVHEQSEDDDDGSGPGSRMNLSTKTILTHYSKLVRDQRIQNNNLSS